MVLGPTHVHAIMKIEKSNKSFDGMRLNCRAASDRASWRTRQDRTLDIVKKTIPVTMRFDWCKSNRPTAAKAGKDSAN